MDPKPTIGRIIHYRISLSDAAEINRRRKDFYEKSPEQKELWVKGAQAHVGNQANEGDIVAAIITAVWGADLINAKAFLDGNDDLWLTSRAPGDGNGQWHWPVRA